MDIRVIKEEQRLESNWSGGKTWELAIFPRDSRYLDRDFIWRLSTANSDREESSFTKLEDYDRILMVLEGDVVLAHADQRSAHLQALEMDRFDGAVKTRCYGKLLRDYNLIYAKGCQARMDLIGPHAKARPIEMSPEALDHVVSYGIFCLEGYVIVSCGEASEMVRPDQQAVIDFPGGVTDDILLMGEGKCILTEVIMQPAHVKADGGNAAEHGGNTGTANTRAANTGTGNVQGAASGPARGAPAETAASTAGASAGAAGAGSASAADRSAFADYKACLKLFLSRNRWSMVMRREGKSNVYYDKALSTALRKIERKYVTLLIWILGIILCCLTVFAGSGPGLLAAIMIAFTIVHFLVIAPCVYMAFLPRPLCDHMKAVSDLNAAEQAYHKAEISEDPHMEKLMNKYKNDDENYFADESSPLRHLIINKEKNEK